MGPKERVDSADRRAWLQLLWKSISVEEKKRILEVSMDKFEQQNVLSKEELSFVQTNKTLKFWMCCDCMVKFVNAESLIGHVWQMHMGHIPDIDDILPQETELIVNKTHIDTPDEFSEQIVVTDGFLHLVMDDLLLGNFDALFTGYTGSAEKWKDIREEKVEKGRDVLGILQNNFNELKGFCKQKQICLKYMETLEGMATTKYGLEKQKSVEKDEIKFNAISGVLEEAIANDVFQQDFDTSIKVIIKKKKDECYADLRRIDVKIRRTVAVEQQLELKLGSHSSYDYQILILPSIKTIIQARLEDLAEKDARDKSAAAEKLLLAELELEENKSLRKEGHHSKQIQEASKKGKRKKKKHNKKVPEVGGDRESAEQGIGTGRKPQMLSLEEIYSQSSYSVDNYRNLGENDLGGVIFGCTDATMKECSLEKIFGLPSEHFKYVKNIREGLPLFLFNYSDRKLYGICEATSQGGMNIKPKAWSIDDSDTQFPAQVSFDILEDCWPLPEELFKPIIENNYFEDLPGHFQFELDHVQASNLIALFSLFSSSPTSGSTSAVSTVPKDDPMYESNDSLASTSKLNTDAPSASLEMKSGFLPDAHKSAVVDPDPNARNEQDSKTLESPILDPSSVSGENQMLESHSDKEDVTSPNVNGEKGVVDVQHEKNETTAVEEDDSSPEVPLMFSKTLVSPILDPSSVSGENQMLESHSDKEEVTSPNVNGEKGVVDVPHENKDTTAVEEDDSPPEVPLIFSKTLESPILDPSSVSAENQMLESHSDKEEVTSPNVNEVKGVVDVPHEKNNTTAVEEEDSPPEVPLIFSKTLESPVLDPSSVSGENQILESHSDKEEVTSPNVDGEKGVVDVPHEKNDTTSVEEEDSTPEVSLIFSKTLESPILDPSSVSGENQMLESHSDKEEVTSPNVDGEKGVVDVPHEKIDTTLVEEEDSTPEVPLIFSKTLESPILDPSSVSGENQMLVSHSDKEEVSSPNVNEEKSVVDVPDEKNDTTSVEEEVTSPSANGENSIVDVPGEKNDTTLVEEEVTCPNANGENTVVDVPDEKNDTTLVEEELTSPNANEENSVVDVPDEKNDTTSVEKEVTSPNVNGEKGVVDVPNEKNDTTSVEEDDSPPEVLLISSSDHKNEDISTNKSFDLQSLLNQFRKETEEVKGLSVKQLQKTASLERKLGEPKFQPQQYQDEVHQLEGHIKQLESLFLTSVRELKGLSAKQLEKIASLERKLGESEFQLQQSQDAVQQLEGRVKQLESQLSTSP